MKPKINEIICRYFSKQKKLKYKTKFVLLEVETKLVKRIFYKDYKCIELY